MQNKSPVDDVRAEVAEPSSQPPIPKDYGPTVSAIAVILSVVAIWVSIQTARYSRRSDRRSLFDSDFGTPLRSALREFEQSVEELSAFIFPSAHDLDALKNELQGTQSKIEEKALICAGLIREVDTAATVSRNDWEREFNQSADAARTRLESLYSPKLMSLAEFQGRADQTRQDYRALIREARTQIDHIRSTCLTEGAK